MMGWFYRHLAEKVLDLLIDHEETQQAHGHDLTVLQNVNAGQPWDDDRYTDAEKAILRKRAQDGR
jgi:hypothetical protein